MNKSLSLLAFTLPFLFLVFGLSSQETNFIGGGDGLSWEDADNWDNGVPTNMLRAVIDISVGDTVEITTSAQASSVAVEAGILIIGSTGSLTIDPNNTTINNSDGIRISSVDAAFEIFAGATLTIRNAADDAISVSLGSRLENKGTISITDCNFGIYDGNFSSSRFSNEGKISISNIGTVAILFGIGTFTNSYCGLITTDNDISAGTMINQGSILYTSDENSTISSNTNTGIIHNLGSGSFTITNDNGRVDTNPAANYWRGCEGTNWADDCNWSRDREPMKADSVVILPNGLEADPVLSTLTDTVMHVWNERLLSIADGGKLIIDGTPSSSELLGLANRNVLAVQSGGSIHVMHTSSDGINSLDAITNDGHILVEDARFAAIQINGTTSTFVTDNRVEIRNSSSTGIRTSFGGSTTNNGIITFSNTDNPINVWEENSTFVNNHSIVSTGGFDAIDMTDAANGISPVFTNAVCAVMTTDTRFVIASNSSIINNGLINYTAPDAILEGTYTDNGYQYDPNNQLPDGITVLDAPRSYDFFNIDIDGDGMTFCEGDTDDIPIPLACGQTLINQTNANGTDNLDGYSCPSSNFSGPEIIYSIQIVAPDTIVGIIQTNLTARTDMIILTDPTDPSSCLDTDGKFTGAFLSPGTYYVVVDGFFGDEGTFDIELRCGPIQTEPIPIACGQTLEDQDNLGSFLLDSYPCRTSPFNGPERIYTFDVTAPETVVFAKLSNESASTDVIILSDPSDPSSCIAWGRAGTGALLSPGTYYLAVDGLFGGLGIFDLSLSCRDIQPGDLCSTAIPIICGQSIEGSLSDAFIDPNNNSGCDLEKRGLWYTFMGSGGDITASLCNTSNSFFDSEIAIFSGACGMLDCSGMQNDDACVSLSELTIPTVQGDTYWVRVTEFQGTEGDFTLTFTCDDDNVCLTERILSGDLDQSLYTASEKIIVDGAISAPSDVRISAPTVEFMKTAEVSDGLLEVDREGCP